MRAGTSTSGGASIRPGDKLANGHTVEAAETVGNIADDAMGMYVLRCNRSSRKEAHMKPSTFAFLKVSADTTNLPVLLRRGTTPYRWFSMHRLHVIGCWWIGKMEHLHLALHDDNRTLSL